MKPSKAVVWLSFLIVVLALIATGTGLFWQGSDGDVGGLILRRAPLGYCLAFPILGLILMLGPTITAATVNQVRAGIQFTTAEAAGPIGGFGLLGLLAIWVTVALLRNIDGPVTVGGTTGRTGLGTGGNAGRKRERGDSG